MIAPVAGMRRLGGEPEQQALVMGDADRIEKSGLGIGNVTTNEGLHRFEGVVERVRAGHPVGRREFRWWRSWGDRRKSRPRPTRCEGECLCRVGTRY